MDEMNRRDFLGVGALAAAAAIDVPEMGVRSLVAGLGRLQPSPRAGQEGAPSGAIEMANPLLTWDVGDGYGTPDTQQADMLKDLIHLGLPNGDLSASDDDDDTSEYWTSTTGTVAWSVVVDATAPGGYVWRYTADAGASSSDATLLSARVPIADVYKMAVGLYYSSTAASSLKVSCLVSILWYDEAGTLVDTTSSSNLTDTLATGSKRLKIYNDIAQNTDSVNAATAAVQLSFSHAVGTACVVDIRTVVFLPLRPGLLVLDPEEDMQADTGYFERLIVGIDAGYPGSVYVQDATGLYTSISISQYLTTDYPALWFYDTSGTQEFSLRRSSANTLKLEDAGLAIDNELRLLGEVATTPGSNQNDYAPTGHASAGRLRITPSASIDITGLAGGTDGRLVVMTNVSGTNTITLKHLNGSSSAANQFACKGSVDYVLDVREVCWLIYDGTSSLWRPFGH